jgi:hypothetical protein
MRLEDEEARARGECLSYSSESDPGTRAAGTFAAATKGTIIKLF